MRSILLEMSGGTREVETPLDGGFPARRTLVDDGDAVKVYEYQGTQDGIRVYRRVSTERK